jgi:hypothetical protein
MQKVSAKPRVLFLLILGAAIWSGCVSKKGLTVWTLEVPSPDGKWVAIADTVQNGGFGSAYIATSVYLRRTRSSREATTMLELSCQGQIPHPYALDNSANAGGSVHLAVQWLDSSHLHVTYDSHPEVLFHALTLGEVHISVDDHSEAHAASQT